MTLKELLFGKSKHKLLPEEKRVVIIGELTQQLKTEIDFVKQIYEKLKLLIENGYDTTKWEGFGYVSFRDSYLYIYCNYIQTTSNNLIDANIFIGGIINNKMVRIVPPLHSLASYNCPNPTNIQRFNTPIKWNCSDECKQNILQYIEDNIFNINVVPLKDQFCKQLSEIKK